MFRKKSNIVCVYFATCEKFFVQIRINKCETFENNWWNKFNTLILTNLTKKKSCDFDKKKRLRFDNETLFK